MNPDSQPDADDVCVLIPTYNEAATVDEVISGFRERGYDNVLVIDGGSDDGTQEVAEEAGARVVEQTGSGKGQAVQEAIGIIEEPYVVMIDGDGTYLPEEVDRLLEPLGRGYDHVIGNRLGNKDAFTRLNYVGNEIFNRMFKLAHGRNLDDILTGYRAFTLESAERMNLEEKGFGIETEMTAEALKREQRMISVDITYTTRPEDSDTKLRPFRDGARIAYTIYRMTKTNNPFFYFGSVGAVLFFSGILSGAYVFYDWYFNSITHEMLAVLTTLLVLAGIQLFIFASLSDIFVDLYRDEMRQMRRIEDAVEDGDDE
ncbi:MAG: S-layer glycoprotein N-glycosyltransferase AglJ [Halobacteria archaeon]|nr:S-layer glycoprotein N-glycosyltransferase AglJ [Halobacteria archaeon]